MSPLMNYYPTPIPSAQQMADGGAVSPQAMSQIQDIVHDAMGGHGAVGLQLARGLGHYKAGGHVKRAAGLVAAHGHGSDTELAHFNKGELNVLDQFNGGQRDINPDTGLPQYGWLGNLLKGLVRAGASIAGGMIAGPAGAALGSGLSTKLTGGSWNDALKGAAVSGIGSFAAQGIGSGEWDPTAKFGGGMQTAAANAPAMSQTLPNGMVASLPASSVAAPSMGAQFLSAAKSAPGITAALGALSQPFDHPSTAAPGPSGPTFAVKPMQRKPMPYEGDYNTYGQGPMHKFYDTINPAPEYVDPVPGGVDYSGYMPGFADGGPVGLAGPTSSALQQAAMAGYMAAKNGGGIKGPGSGTSDSVPAMLSDGEHVIPAREISALGNGSNDAGQKRLYKMRKSWLTQAGYKDSNPKKLPKNVKIGIGA